MAPQTPAGIVRQASNWSIVWGVLLIIFGMLAISSPFLAAVAVNVVIAWLIVLAGVVHLVLAFRAHVAGSVIWKLRPRPGVRFGLPLDFSRYAGMSGERFVLRSVTDEIMYELMLLSGQEYVDTYATKAKADIAEARQAAAEALVTDDSVLVGAGRKAS